MRRRIRIGGWLLLLLGFGTACGAVLAQEKSGAAKATNDEKIDALKRDRIGLLEQRVKHLRTLAKQGVIGVQSVTAAQIDLLRVRLEYAQSKAEKKKILTDLIKHYEMLIKVAKLETGAPATAPRSGVRRAHGVQAGSEVLRLQADRVGLQVELLQLGE